MAQNKNVVCDHNGKQFAGITQMCEFYGVSRSAYNHRISRGWSLEEALTTPVGVKVKRNLKTPAEVKEYNHSRRIAYYQKHREEAREYNKQYYQEHREKYLDYQSRYRAAHSDYWRGYYAAQKKYEVEGICNE